MTATAVEALEAIRRDPVGFCRTVLRFEPWSKQREILESVRDNRRTAVRSAHGVGKTAVAARMRAVVLGGVPVQPCDYDGADVHAGAGAVVAGDRDRAFGR